MTKKVLIIIIVVLANISMVLAVTNHYSKLQEIDKNTEIISSNEAVMKSNKEIIDSNKNRLDALDLKNKALDDNIKSINKALESLQKQVEELNKKKLVTPIAITKTKVSPSRGGNVSYSTEKVSFKKKINAVVTAYTLNGCGKSPGDKGYGITASGKTAKANWTVAVDTSIIPMGSKIYIPYFKEYPNKGIFYAEDTGVKGLFGVDVFVHSDTTARKIGRSVKEIYILK